MCRGGRMFAPTRIWRRWHRHINKNQRRFATVSGIAATALPALIMARGHRIEQVPEVPLVISNGVESLTKTKAAVSLLKKLNAYDDVQKCIDSKKIRAGKGKMRNRRYTMRRGPLLIYNEDHGIRQAFRNLPGVELLKVDRMNLLQLCPGGHLGRWVLLSEKYWQSLGDHCCHSVKKASTNYKIYVYFSTSPFWCSFFIFLSQFYLNIDIYPSAFFITAPISHSPAPFSVQALLFMPTVLLYQACPRPVEKRWWTNLPSMMIDHWWLINDHTKVFMYSPELSTWDDPSASCKLSTMSQNFNHFTSSHLPHCQKSKSYLMKISGGRHSSLLT